MDGIVVSNHGGRQVDGAIATMDALPGIVEAVAGRVPIVLDSGNPLRRRRVPCARARRIRGRARAAVRLGARSGWRGGRARGDQEHARRLRPDHGLAGVASVRDIGRRRHAHLSAEAVVFDLDGVLVDSDHIWHEVREGSRASAAGAGPTIRRRT